MKTLFLTILIMVTVYAMPQDWNYPNYNVYYFGAASIHVSDTLTGYEGQVGLYDSLGFYNVQIGDKIGFFDSDGLCCGYNVIETFSNLGISLVGDIPNTPFKEGFCELDSMYLRIWSCSLLREFECDFISYMTPEEDPTILPDFYYWDGLFHNTGLYVVDTLTKYVPFERQYIAINQGWGGISSYLLPVNHSLETIFDGIPLVILKTGAYAYMPDEFNTIGSWQNKGYQINVSEGCTLEMVGLEIQDKTVELAAGWGLLPILSTTPIYCDFDITGEYDLIQSFNGLVYWPYQGIHTLEYLIPGKAYQVHLDSPFTLDFEQDQINGQHELQHELPHKKAIFHKGRIYLLFREADEWRFEELDNLYDLNGKLMKRKDIY